jgi:membrane protein DedA with SNARE-associated domain
VALLALPIVVLSLTSAAGNVMAPHLLAANPLLLAALSPRAIHLVVAAGSAPLPVFLAVGMLRLVAADPWHYLLGRMHGPAVAEALSRRSAGLGRLAAWILRIDQRKGLMAVAASPTGKVLMVAGAARLRPSRVAAADAAGTLVQLGVLYVSGRPLVHALKLSPEAMAIVGVGSLVLAVAGPAIVARATARRSRPGPPEPAIPVATVGA